MATSATATKSATTAAACLAGTAFDPDDGNPCTDDSCDPLTGVSHAPAISGTSCADADACNGDETCDGASSCIAGVPPMIDDGDPCTVDMCRPGIGVTHHACSALDLTVATSLYEQSAYLFTGADPPQMGVAPGAISPIRIARLRGLVKDVAGDPLPGVTVRVLPLDPHQPDYAAWV